MLANRRGSRARWLPPVVVIAVVASVVWTTLAATGVLSHDKKSPSGAPPSNRGGSTVATVSQVVRPVTLDGQPATGFTTTPLDGTVDCSIGESSPSVVAVDDNIGQCFPTAFYLPACWTSARVGYVLCMRDPRGTELVEVQTSDGLAPVSAIAHPVPLGVLLADGTWCTIRVGGAGDHLDSQPSLSATYFCGDQHDQALWAASAQATFDKSDAKWTVQLAPADGQTAPHTVTVASAYFVGSAQS